MKMLVKNLTSLFLTDVIAHEKYTEHLQLGMWVGKNWEESLLCLLQEALTLTDKNIPRKPAVNIASNAAYLWAGYLPPIFVACPRLLTTIENDVLNDDITALLGLWHVV